MARRLRIKLEIVSPEGSSTLEIGKHPSEPGVGRDPTTADYAMANACTLLLLGVPINEKARAILVKAIDNASKVKAQEASSC